MITALASDARTARRSSRTVAMPGAWAALSLVALLAACSDTATQLAAPTTPRHASGASPSGGQMTPGTEETEPALRFTPDSLAFGVQAVGTHVVKAIQISNTGTANLLITGLNVVGPNAGDYAINDGPVPCPINAPLTPSSRCDVIVTFTPSAVGTRLAALSVASNAFTAASASLSGTGYVPQPMPKLTPNPVDFGARAIGAQSPARALTIANVGTADLPISSLKIIGANAGDFAVANNTAAPCPANGVLAPSTQCTVSVTFNPSATGARSASLTLDSTRAGYSAALTGQGYVSADLGVIMTAALAANREITYGITLTNNGPSTATGISLTDVLPAGTTFVSLTAPPDLFCTTPVVGSSGQIACTASVAAVGNPRTVQFVVRATPVANGDVTNTASVTTGSLDPVSSNNSATVVTPLRK